MLFAVALALALDNPPGTDVADAGPAEVPASDAGPAEVAPPKFVPPSLVHAEDPPYPVEDQAKGVEGDVVLRLTIDTNGDVSEAVVISTPSPAMGESAKNTALKFKFTPAMSGDKPEAAIVRYTLQFRIKKAPPENATTPTSTTPSPNTSTPNTSTPTVPTPEEAAAAAMATDAGETTVTQIATSAASAQSVYDQDLKQRIIRTPADLLHSVPGLFTAQHQGGGKADQYFLRGFDADHGSDVDFTMDGVPINLPSNGHGQGYTDVHFILPEVVDRIEFSKGPYFADKGDFDTAGAVDLHTRKTFAESEVEGMYGQFNTWRVAGVGTSGTGPNAGWIAGEVYGTDGWYAAPEGLQRYSLMAKQNLQISPEVRLTLQGIAYASQWSASGLIPPRAVDDGEIGTFGSIDSNEGGQTQRQMFIATLHTKLGDNEGLDLTGYVTRFQMRLFNDFTFFLTDPVNGDLVEQNDDRVYTGVVARYHKMLRLGDMQFTTTFGASGRFDSMNVSLFHDDDKRQHLSTCYGMPLFCDDSDIGQSNEAAWVEENARFTQWLRVVAGVRGDLFTWNVVDRRLTPIPGALPTTGVVEKSIVSPKLAIVASPLDNWDIFVDGGGGFHSNDARGIIASNGVGALPRAWGSEIGTRVNLWDRIDLSSALWLLYLEDEVAFDPDTDTTGNNPPTLRYGVDLAGRFNIYDDMIFGDLDLTLDHPQYLEVVDGGTNIELAPTQTLTAGVSAVTPFGLRGRVAVREVADHPASPDGKKIASGYAIFDVTAAYRWQFVEVNLSVENLFDTPWKEGQFDYASRLPFEPKGGIDEVDFTSGAPFNVQGGIAFYF
jgi:TonB family protein